MLFEYWINDQLPDNNHLPADLNAIQNLLEDTTVKWDKNHRYEDFCLNKLLLNVQNALLSEQNLVLFE